MSIQKERNLKIRNQRDFGAGVMYMVIGLFFAIVATRYTYGTAAKMGPGYFPFWLGTLMASIGLLVLLRSLSAKATIEALPKFNFKVVGLITAAVVVFGILLPKMGFLVAVLALVMIASTASREFNWKVALINAVVLIAFTYSVFVIGLKLQFPILPFFLQQ
jgi:hypothetical protein